MHPYLVENKILSKMCLPDMWKWSMEKEKYAIIISLQMATEQYSIMIVN